DVGPWITLLEVLEERGVNRHDVLEVPVLRAVLHHQDLPIAFDDRGLDLADLLRQQHRVVALAVEDLLPGLAYADRTERVGLARPAKRRLDLLPRLEQRLLGPPGRQRLIGLDAVEGVEHGPGAARHERQSLFDVLDRLVHDSETSTWISRGTTRVQSTCGRGPHARPGGPDLGGQGWKAMPPTGRIAAAAADGGRNPPNGQFRCPSGPSAAMSCQPVLACKPRFGNDLQATRRRWRAGARGASTRGTHAPPAARPAPPPRAAARECRPSVPRRSESRRPPLRHRPAGAVAASDGRAVESCRWWTSRPAPSG